MVWNNGYQINFSEWKIEITIDEIEQTQDFHLSNVLILNKSKIEREISLKSHKLKLYIQNKEKKVTKKHLRTCERVIKILSREVYNFQKNHFSKETLSLKENEMRSGWVFDSENENVERIDDPFFKHNKVICKIDKMPISLFYQDQECETCLDNLIYKDRFAFLHKVDINSGQANVWKCYDLSTQRLVVLKEYLSEDRVHQQMFQREVFILSKIDQISQDNQNSLDPLVICKHFYNDQKVLVMEWIENESIQKIDFSIKNRLYNMFFSVLQVLTLLHDNGIVHQDINDPNILFNKEKESFCLIDFGTIIRQQYIKTRDKSFLSFGKSGRHKYLVPPEQQLSRPSPTTKSDLFSLGMLCKHLAEKNKILLTSLDANFLYVLNNMCRNLPENEILFETAREVLEYLQKCKEFVQLYPFTIPKNVGITIVDPKD